MGSSKTVRQSTASLFAGKVPSMTVTVVEANTEIYFQTVLQLKHCFPLLHLFSNIEIISKDKKT